MRKNRLSLKMIATLAVVLTVVFVFQTSYSQTQDANESLADQVLTEGMKLYQEGEYLGAIVQLTRVLRLSESKLKLSQAYFYLALSYYCQGKNDQAMAWAIRAVSVEPDRELDNLIPPGFVNFLETAKKRLLEGDRIEPSAPNEDERPVVAARPASRKEGGRKTIYIVLGAMAIGGAVAAYFLLKGREPKTGTIQVNSTPEDAKIFLDEKDTGKTTNTTLSDVSVGSHQLKLAREGYKDYLETVTVGGDETTTIDAVLAKHTITVTHPGEGVTWYKGESAEIKWTTDTSSAQRIEIRGQGQAVGPFGRQGGLAVLSRSAPDAALNPRRPRGGVEVSKTNPPDAAGLAASVSRETGRGRASAFDSVRNPLFESPLRRNSGLPVSKEPGRQLPFEALAVTNVKIELFQEGDLIETITSSAANQGTFPWVVSQSPDSGGGYKIRVSCAEDAGVYGESGAFTISSPYQIVIDKPNDRTAWGKGKQVEIAWTVKGRVTRTRPLAGKGERNGFDPNIGERAGLRSQRETAGPSRPGTPSSSNAGAPSITNVKIDLFKGTAPVAAIVHSTANDGTYTWTVDDSLEDGCDYRVVVGDASDPGLSGESQEFALTKVSYSYQKTWGGSGAGDGLFEGPVGIAGDGQSYFYVTDILGNRIQKFDIEGNFVSAFLAGTGGAGEGDLFGPWGIAVDEEGGVYVCEIGNSRFQKFDQAGRFLFSVGKQGSEDGQFDQIFYIALSSDGNIFVTDAGNKRVQVFDSTGTYLNQWGGDGVGEGQFKGPAGIAIDAGKSWIYVVDNENYRVQKFDRDGNFLYQWGTQGSGNDQFGNPISIAVDKHGFVYVSDSTSPCVKKFTPQGTFCCKFGNLSGALITPTGILVASDGSVHVLDADHGSVKVFK